MGDLELLLIVGLEFEKNELSEGNFTSDDRGMNGRCFSFECSGLEMAIGGSRSFFFPLKRRVAQKVASRRTMRDPMPMLMPIIRLLRFRRSSSPVGACRISVGDPPGGYVMSVGRLNVVVKTSTYILKELLQGTPSGSLIVFGDAR